MYAVRRREEISYVAPYEGRAEGFTRAPLVGAASESVHMSLSLASLADGHVDEHVHSFEESFYVLEGEPVLYLQGRGVQLASGACGVVPPGMQHAWLDTTEGGSRWVEMCAPRPRPDTRPADTFWLGPTPDVEPEELDLRDPRNRHLFFLSEADMNIDELKKGALVASPTVSASMATAALAYSGITVKMLVDKRLGAQLQTMFMVDYQPGAVAHLHDHPFEEAYYMLRGEIDVVADGHRHTLRPGDAFWTGVGCIHAFYETRGEKVRWLETSAPQPPNRHSYRFNRDWDYLAESLHTATAEQRTA